MSSAPKLFIEQSGHTYYIISLEEREYARAIQSLVFVCTDIGIIDVSSKMIYLAQRALRPGSGWWWFIGGRSHIGETEYQSAQRCFKRETGLLIAEERFNFVCMNRYFFKDRQQEPREVGCDSLCYTLSLNLTDEERAQITLDSSEYLGGGLQAFDYERLKSTEGVHDPVRDFYTKIFG